MREVRSVNRVELIEASQTWNVMLFGISVLAQLLLSPGFLRGDGDRVSLRVVLRGNALLPV